MASPSQIINVASVPNRSPFRYAGGKTWFIPHTRKWLSSLKIKPVEFVEPFLGGGITSLTVAFERLSQHITMVELDSEVAAVGSHNGDARNSPIVLRVEFNLPNVKDLWQKFVMSMILLLAIVKNRATRAVFGDGVGLIKGGERERFGFRCTRTATTPNPLHLTIRTYHFVKAMASSHAAISHNAVRIFIDPPIQRREKRGQPAYTHSHIDPRSL